MEEELRAVLTTAQHDIKKKEQFCVERYDLSEKLSAQNKDLQATIGSITEEVDMAHRSFEASEERAIDLEKTMAVLWNDLTLA